MACLRIAGAGTAGFTALDVALGERAAAHGLGLSQLRGQIANASRDFMRIGHSQIPPYGYISRKITPLQLHFDSILTSMSCTLHQAPLCTYAAQVVLLLRPRSALLGLGRPRG